MSPLRTRAALAASSAFAAGLVLAVAALVLAYLSIQELVRSTRLEERTLAVVAQLDSLVGSVASAEETHEFLLERLDPARVRAFARAARAARREAEELAYLVVDEVQGEVAARLSLAVSARMADLVAELSARGVDAPELREFSLGPALAGTTPQSRRTLPRALVNVMRERQRELIADRREEAHRSVRLTTALVGWGGVIAIALFIMAMTMLRRSQEQRESALARLAAAEQRLALATEGSALAVWDWDVQSDRVFLTPTWAEIIGEERHEVTTTSAALVELVHPEDQAPVREALAQALAGDVYEVEHRVRTAQGDYRWINSRGRVVERDAAGQALRMTGTNRDITTRKRAQEALAAREQQLRLIADSVPAMITNTDAEERYRFHNRAFAEFVGKRHEEIEGRTIREVIGEERYRRIEPYLRRAATGEAVSFERQEKRSDGSMLDLAVRYVPQRDARGSIVGVFVLATDISELKKLDRMKDEFVATVSHELRTPLTSIRASLALLHSNAAGELPRDAARLIEVATNNCERLVRLVNNILDVQKMRAGKLETAAREVDLAVLLKQTLEANEGYAVEHGVRLHYSAAGASIRVRADPDRLAQVVTNLVSNAVKFSPRGASVRVRAESRNGQARVLVEDAGPGVPEDFREQLFRPFAQADGSVTRSRGGTGLGLSIAKTLVESAGGRIGVDSPQGRGATFWFELPLVEPVR